jgi:hypothetical protein
VLQFVRPVEFQTGVPIASFPKFNFTAAGRNLPHPELNTIS